MSRRVSSLYNLDERRSDKVLQTVFIVSGPAAAAARILGETGLLG